MSQTNPENRTETPQSCPATLIPIYDRGVKPAVIGQLLILHFEKGIVIKPLNFGTILPADKLKQAIDAIPEKIIYSKTKKELLSDRMRMTIDHIEVDPTHPLYPEAVAQHIMTYGLGGVPVYTFPQTFKRGTYSFQKNK
jgi:hypothetical protein